jgi:hypothetical protein
MIRFFAKRYARVRYRFNQETEAASNDLNAGLATRLAKEKRTLVARLNAEADQMDARITEVGEMEEKGYWLCENGHEIQLSCHCAGNSGEAIVHTAACPLPDDATKDGQPIANAVTSLRCDDCGKPMKYIRRDQMTGQEKYESDKERKEAEQIAADKRAQADKLEANAKDFEGAAQNFMRQAAQSREFADLLRDL